MNSMHTPMHPGPAALPPFEVQARNDDHSVRVWGSAQKQGEASLYLENPNPSDPFREIVLHLAADTAILDAVTGEARRYEDLRHGESLVAWTSPMMTRSIPPQSTARVVVCNLPADFAAPTYAQVQAVSLRAEGGLDVLMSGDTILHLSAETPLRSPDSAEAPTWTQIVPGAMLLSWYSQVALSLPAQAWPTQVMVFPSAYAGYVSAAPGALSLNGTPLALRYDEGPFVSDGALMVPLDVLTRTLGAALPQDVTPTTTRRGEVVFAPLDDLLGPLRLKFVPPSIFFQ